MMNKKSTNEKVERITIDNVHYITNDMGKHLYPCVKEYCNGIPSPNTKSPIVEITKHQVEHLHDPLARQSHVTFKASNCYKNSAAAKSAVGDGDVWVETLCKHIKTGKIKSFFKSTKDPRRILPEPPTGASHVVFLRQSYIDKFTK